jgi:hypothetical protein
MTALRANIARSPNEPSLGTAPQKVAPHVRGVKATKHIDTFPTPSSQSWRVATVWDRLRGRCPRKESPTPAKERPYRREALPSVCRYRHFRRRPRPPFRASNKSVPAKTRPPFGLVDQLHRHYSERTKPGDCPAEGGTTCSRSRSHKTCRNQLSSIIPIVASCPCLGPPSRTLSPKNLSPTPATERPYRREALPSACQTRQSNRR